MTEDQMGERRARRRSRDDYGIASLDSMIQRTQELSRGTGQNPDEAATVVVEELEREAVASTARTAPLVPGCGILIAASGFLVKAEPTSRPVSAVFLGLAVVCAIAGFAFLTQALVLYAGRRSIGLPANAADIAFARDRLVRKRRSAHWGRWLAGIGLTFLAIGFLSGVRVSIG